MSSLRSLQPLARQAPRALTRHTPTTTAATQRRLLNTATAPVLYSAHAKVVGARTGHVDGDDLRVDLTMAKALGGAGDRGKTNPEELFAAGYGACFQSAMNAAAASLGVRMPARKEDSVVETTVHLVGDMAALDMGLRVEMKVRVRGLGEGDLRRVVDRAKEVCPYSRATRGNIATDIEVVHEGGGGGGSSQGSQGARRGPSGQDLSDEGGRAGDKSKDVGNPEMPSKGSSTYG